MTERGFLGSARQSFGGRAFAPPSGDFHYPRFELKDNSTQADPWFIHLELLGVPSNEKGRGVPRWSWRKSREHGPNEPVNSFDRSIVAQALYTRSFEESKLTSSWQPKESVYLDNGPFIVDWLYLSRFAPSDVLALDRACRLARFLKRFWEQQVKMGAPEAGLILPMARRTYWRALSHVIEQAEHAWQERSDSEKGRSKKDSSRVEYEDIRDFLRYDLFEVDPGGDRAWLGSWIHEHDLKTEYMTALRDWQEVCTDDRYAGFFMEVLGPWLDRPAHTWQQLREAELNATLWNVPIAEPPGVYAGAATAAAERVISISKPPNEVAGRKWTTLGSPLMNTLEMQARLQTLIDTWYLPRYDLASVCRIRPFLDIDCPDQWWLRWWRRFSRNRIWNRLQPYGVSRLWAGILLGYLVTMFQSDTWTFFESLATNRRKTGIGFGLFLLLAIAWVLYVRIRLKTGKSDTSLILRRVWGVIWRGEVFALLLGALILPVVGGAIGPKEGMLTEWDYWPPEWSRDAAGQWIFLLAIYAQAAMFIGVFTHLIFDERSATEPLSGP